VVELSAAGILAGARLSVAVEPADLLKKLQTPKAIEDAKSAINSVPGLKITLDPEISITFTPK